MDGIFLVLEPGNHMFKVIEAAQRRGLTVVVCHSSPVSPSAPFVGALSSISHFLKVDGWRNDEGAFEAIVAWCGDRPVRGTYAGFEITLKMEARLRDHYALVGSGTKTVDLVLNKAAVRSLLREAGLTKLRAIEDRAVRELTEWPFPGRAAFLKPINGSGSTYVRRCISLQDVQEHLAAWDSNARHIRRFVADYVQAGLGMFLEEEAVGELLSLEGYCHDGRYVAIGITDRTVLARDVAIEMGNTFPCPHPRSADIVAKVEAIHKLLGITHGPTHTEVVVPEGDGEVELVELNLRFAGGDILILVNRALGITFEEDLLTLATGEGPLTVIPNKPRCYASGQDFLAPAGLESFEAIDIPGDDVFFQKVTVKPGALKSTNFQSDHIAAYAVAADSYRGALARAMEVRAATSVNGVLLGEGANNVVINYADRWISSL